MSYIGQACWGADPFELQNYEKLTNALGVSSYLGLRQPFAKYVDELLKCDIRIALWRDPVEKFLSGYRHLANKGLVQEKCISRFLDNFELHVKDIKVWDHCSSNSTKLGADKSIYTHVVNHTEVDCVVKPLIENLSGVRLRHVELRVQKTKELPAYEDVL